LGPLALAGAMNGESPVPAEPAALSGAIDE
jgi:hypothetical protein